MLTQMRAGEILTAESVAHEIGELVAERQDLRARGASTLELEASRRALKRSEAFLLGAFEAAPIGKTFLDPDGRIGVVREGLSQLVCISARTSARLVDYQLSDSPVSMMSLYVCG